SIASIDRVVGCCRPVRSAAHHGEVTRMADPDLPTLPGKGNAQPAPTAAYETKGGGDSAAPEPLHETIGPYETVGVIGKGGMGVVYLAEQKAPVRRRVALKLIKRGMDTQEVIARFQAERQVLALLNHPHIAKVLDAGATDNGRPYFVME